MHLHPLDLTSALRPALLQDETLLFVQGAVGLYQGSLKVADYQNGHVYLTSHRACYVDDEDPRGKSVVALLKDVERCELYAGFLKSSPKITLHPKAAKHFGQVHRTPSVANGLPTTSNSQGSFQSKSQASTPKPVVNNATWICPICGFSNPAPSTFDPKTANDSTPLPACSTCGMKPPLTVLVKASLAAMANRPSGGTVDARSDASASMTFQDAISEDSCCPRCTFANHPSMTSCEICGAPLQPSTPQQQPSTPDPTDRTDSPGPSSTFNATPRSDNPMESTKFSFRSGGEKIFHDRLKGALTQRKWLLQSAPSTPFHDSSASFSPSSNPPQKTIGISGLERRDREQRKNNEVVIGNAFEDLSALMASAKDIIALAETFAKHKNGQNGEGHGDDPTDQASTLLSSLNLTTTKDMLGSSAGSGGHTTYLTQLSRSLADFLLDDTSGTALLKSSGGIISLVDLWAVYNRARGGMELVSPMDFSEAVEMFEKLRLPVQARVFRGSGLRVVRGAEWSDERVVKSLLRWLAELRTSAGAMEAGGAVGVEGEGGVNWGRGVTALEAAERFGWSVGVASEEMGMAEEKGALCREMGLEGVRFWENWFVRDLGELDR